jgi:hypothetical protein
MAWFMEFDPLKVDSNLDCNLVESDQFLKKRGI